MADTNQHNADGIDRQDDHPQASTTTSNTVTAGTVTGLVQTGVITGGIHHHPPAPQPPVPTPQQLASAPAGFVGRLDQLAALDHALDTSGGRCPQDGGRGIGATAVISAIGGAGGIGKTWLALAWANHNLHYFPDGQLAVDLRGFSPGAPKHPGDALAEFLAALGVDRDHQPTDPDARAALYRTHTAGKRLLILLDNAATTNQVEPLLPGGNSCTVLITSRSRLPALLARHSAHPVYLDVLTDIEARTLLHAAVGDTHTAVVEGAVTDLITLCGRFPLALGLIAARIRTHPDLLDDVVTELRDLGIGALDSDDPDASLPAVLSWSLRRLTNRHRTVFGLLGIAPGPDIDLPAATSLTGLSERDTRTVLRGLVDASLITPAPGRRYWMHDLVRDYATTNAHQDLTTDVREAALRRVVNFYWHTAHTAERLLYPHSQPIRLDSPAPGCVPHPLSDAAAALAWFDAEHACLLAAQDTAVTQGWHQAVWALAWNLYTFLYRRGHRHDRLAVWRAGLAAAEHLPDPTIHTRAHRALGDSYAALGRHEEAIEHLHQALALAEHHHDHINQARAHHALAWAWEQQGDNRRALEHATHALTLHRTFDFDDPVLEARTLNWVGWYSARCGEYKRAREHCQAALTLHRHHHNPDGEAATLDSLGYIDHHTGHHQQAIHHYRQALTLHRDIGHTYDVANTLDLLGHPYVALSQHDQARAVWRDGLELCRQQGRDEDADRVQQQLDDLDNPGGAAGSHK